MQVVVAFILAKRVPEVASFQISTRSSDSTRSAFTQRSMIEFVRGARTPVNIACALTSDLDPVRRTLALPRFAGLGRRESQADCCSSCSRRWQAAAGLAVRVDTSASGKTCTSGPGWVRCHVVQVRTRCLTARATQRHDHPAWTVRFGSRSPRGARQCGRRNALGGAER